MVRRPPEPPEGAAVTRYLRRVPFYETDAMGIVHHGNYARWFEDARVRWLDEHQKPYRDWVARGLHFAVTRLEVEYGRAARFDDEVVVETWLDEVRGASLRMAYLVSHGGVQIASGTTEHALVNETGRPRRIPREERDALRARLAPNVD